MDGWAKLQSGIGGLNLGQQANKFAKGFTSSVQATRERLGQVAPEEITELPQGEYSQNSSLSYRPDALPEYKDLEARVDALREAHLSILKCELFRCGIYPLA
jgi:hypothetical protein